YRSNIDSTTISVSCTGYYYMAGGNATASNGLKAQQAVIEGKYRLTNALLYLTATPNLAQIDPGATYLNGSIYANSLNFLPGSTNICSAIYYTTATYMSGAIVRCNGTAYSAVKANYPVNFAALDQAVRGTYKAKRASSVPTFEGTVGPGDSPVYYVE